jgi:hypothetical protein
LAATDRLLILLVAAFLSEEFMTYSFRSTGALAVLWLGALAAIPAVGQNKGSADPADPATPVPPTRYVPMPSPPAAVPASSPADSWKALNHAVASYDPMSLTMEIAAPAALVGAGRANAVAPMPAVMAQPVPPTAHPTPAARVPDVHDHHMKKEVK